MTVTSALPLSSMTYMKPGYRAGAIVRDGPGRRSPTANDVKKRLERIEKAVQALRPPQPDYEGGENDTSSHRETYRPEAH